MKKKILPVVLTGMMLSLSMAGCSENADANKENTPKENKPAYYSELGFETVTSEDELLAFPGAQGYGKYTAGGRGGRVIYVTNLNDSGEGSLRAAVEAEGPRVVVFKVSGYIMLESDLRIQNPYITIAGQTAPGDGICLRNYQTVVETTDVIISYLRSRPANVEAMKDGIWVRDTSDVVIDHVSASFSTDETLSVTDSGNVTVQDCIIAESLNQTKQGTHGMGSIICGYNDQKVTYYRNLYSTHRSRMPVAGNRYDSTTDPFGFNMELINNVLHNWSGDSCGKNHDEATCISRFNVIGNYYVQGRVSTGTVAWSEGVADTRNYMEGNAMNGVIPEDQYSLVEVEEEAVDFSWEKYKDIGRFEDSLTDNVMTAEDAYEYVLEHAGCSLSRDSFDTAIVELVPLGKQGRNRLINKPEEAAGWTGDWPELVSTEAYPDKDNDGMDDTWETSVGLDPEDAEDGNKTVAGGYTNLEVFLASLRN